MHIHVPVGDLFMPTMAVIPKSVVQKHYLQSRQCRVVVEVEVPSEPGVPGVVDAEVPPQQDDVLREGADRVADVADALRQRAVVHQSEEPHRPLVHFDGARHPAARARIVLLHNEAADQDGDDVRGDVVLRVEKFTTGQHMYFQSKHFICRIKLQLRRRE